MSRKMRLRGVCAVALASVVMLVGANTAFGYAYTNGTKQCTMKQVGALDFRASGQGAFRSPGSRITKTFLHTSDPQNREANSERQGGGAWFVRSNNGLIQWATPSCINGLL